MSSQQNMLPPIHHPASSIQEFYLTVLGEAVHVKYQPDPFGWTEDNYSARKPYRNIHIEFLSVPPGPISETGYRSCFVNGTPEELGIDSDNIADSLQHFAEKLADEYATKRRCIVCHCVDEGHLPDSCWKDGKFCHWIAEDLCSACLEAQS